MPPQTNSNVINIVLWLLVILLGGGSTALVVALYKQRQLNKESDAKIASSQETLEVDLTERIKNIVDKQIEGMSQRLEALEDENAKNRRLFRASLNFIQQLLSHIWILRTHYVDQGDNLPNVPSIPAALDEYVVPYDDETKKQ